MTGNVDEGDVVRVVFTIASNRSNVPLSLVSYKTPEDVFHAETAYLQQIFDLDNGVFTGSGSLTVTVPYSFFQIDFVCGAAIDRFGPANSNIFYSAQSRLFDADNGGTASSLAGYVYRDDNNNGVKSGSEPGIASVKITFTGTNDLNQFIHRTVTTSSSGAYSFGNLRPGVYQIKETQPTNYNDGQESLGTAGGVKGNDVFSSIVLGAKINGKNYNFGELKKNQNLIVSSASTGLADSSDLSEPSDLSDPSDARAEVLSKTLVVSLRNSEGRLDLVERARIMNAVSTLNDAFGQLGISVLVTVDATAPADVYLTIADSSPCGAATDGVLGCATVDGGITLIDGWNWYVGGDAGAIGRGQYDFQSIVTHELGHSLGLGHSHDPSSVMYEALAPGVARRGLTANDLSGLAHNDDAEEAPKSILAGPPAKVELAPPTRTEIVHLSRGWNHILVLSAVRGDCDFDSDFPQRDSLTHSSGKISGGSTGSCDDVLVGGEGDNVLVGGTGQDLMLGGFGEDGPIAPADDGILIDGCQASNVFDLALDAVLQEWSD